MSIPLQLITILAVLALVPVHVKGQAATLKADLLPAEIIEAQVKAFPFKNEERQMRAQELFQAKLRYLETDRMPTMKGSALLSKCFGILGDIVILLLLVVIDGLLLSLLLLLYTKNGMSSPLCVGSCTRVILPK